MLEKENELKGDERRKGRGREMDRNEQNWDKNGAMKVYK
jgi:hypothetical protein